MATETVVVEQQETELREVKDGLVLVYVRLCTHHSICRHTHWPVHKISLASLSPRVALSHLGSVGNTRGDDTSEEVVLQCEYLAMLHGITVTPRRGNRA